MKQWFVVFVAVVVVAVIAMCSVSMAGNEGRDIARYDWKVTDKGEIYVFEQDTGEIWHIYLDGEKWFRQHITGKRLIQK
jgi:hypothetical protein